MNPLDILAPNYLGYEVSNSNVESIVQNYGYGVAEVNPKKMEQSRDTSGPLNKLRVAKAREFGKPKTEVGF